MTRFLYSTAPRALLSLVVAELRIVRDVAGRVLVALGDHVEVGP